MVTSSEHELVFKVEKESINKTLNAKLHAETKVWSYINISALYAH